MKKISNGNFGNNEGNIQMVFVKGIGFLGWINNCNLISKQYGENKWLYSPKYFEHNSFE